MNNYYFSIILNDICIFSSKNKELANEKLQTVKNAILSGKNVLTDNRYKVVSEVNKSDYINIIFEGVNKFELVYLSLHKRELTDKQKNINF